MYICCLVTTALISLRRVTWVKIWRFRINVKTTSGPVNVMSWSKKDLLLHMNGSVLLSWTVNTFQVLSSRDATNLQFHYPPRPAATPCPTTTTRKLILAGPNPQKTRNFKNLLLQEKNTAGSMLELYKPYLLHCCAEKDSQTNSKDLKLLC